MKKIRIIPRLDIKGPNVVKGIQFEGLRVVGNPFAMAKKYYEQGADELLYIDIVASLYNRNNLTHIIEETTQKGISIPLTVGGGIRTIDDITKILRSGADKVAINTAAVKNPEFLREASRKFGSSTIVLSIEAKKIAEGKWEAYIDNGRERTGLDVIAWAKKAVDFGVGEILITSVDKEGTKTGYDMDLINATTAAVSVPVTASGGAGRIEHLQECLANDRLEGVALANLLHYDTVTVQQIKKELGRRYPEKIHSTSQYVVRESATAVEQVSILDYGLGNIRSIKNAFEELGVKVNLISSPEEIGKAKHLILPGVGSFEEGIRNLRSAHLDQAIIDYVGEGKFLLGICLGMQLLMTKSYEFGEHTGLGIIEGEVLRFEEGPLLLKQPFKVPHVGWNKVALNRRAEDILFDGKIHDFEAYFVHSYYVKPVREEYVLATTSYGGQEFCSLVAKDNVYGCQFHPEKSGGIGLYLLKEFLRLSIEGARR